MPTCAHTGTHIHMNAHTWPHMHMHTHAHAHTCPCCALSHLCSPQAPTGCGMQPELPLSPIPGMGGGCGGGHSCLSGCPLTPALPCPQMTSRFCSRRSLQRPETSATPRCEWRDTRSPGCETVTLTGARSGPPGCKSEIPMGVRPEPPWVHGWVLHGYELGTFMGMRLGPPYMQVWAPHGCETKTPMGVKLGLPSV